MCDTIMMNPHGLQINITQCSQSKFSYHLAIANTTNIIVKNTYKLHNSITMDMKQWLIVDVKVFHELFVVFFASNKRNLFIDISTSFKILCPNLNIQYTMIQWL